MRGQLEGKEEGGGQRQRETERQKHTHTQKERQGAWAIKSNIISCVYSYHFET